MQQWKAMGIEVNYKATLIQPNDVVLGMTQVSLLPMRNKQGTALLKVMMALWKKLWIA